MVTNFNRETNPQKRSVFPKFDVLFNLLSRIRYHTYFFFFLMPCPARLDFFNIINRLVVKKYHMLVFDFG